MASGLVIGIFQNADAKALESALNGQQLDLSKIKVLVGDGENTESSALHFIDVVEETEPEGFPPDSMTEGTGVMQDFGTNVPGLGGREPTLESFEHQGGTTKHYLAGFAVPDDEVENFDDAVDEGRAVVLYPDAGADAEKIAAAFRAAGLRNVRSY